MSSVTGSLKSELASLSSEILLKTFLNLESHETVILRSVCKQFLGVIDNNKSLWRGLEWDQQEEESPIQALEMFDEKSASTLREVSIFQTKGESDIERILEILRRSRDTLTDLSLMIRPFREHFSVNVIELVSDSPAMNSLLLWPSSELWRRQFPMTRLARRGKQLPLSAQKSSDIQILWYFNMMMQGNGKLDVSSLVSFADPSYTDSLQVRSFISKFSSTLVHLSMHSDNGITTLSLSCPSLRILEGRFYSGFPSWLDAPNLRVVIASSVFTGLLLELPISVEELWLLSWSLSRSNRNLDFLPQVCPQLKVLKLGHGLFIRNPHAQKQMEIKDISESFKAREEKVREGVEIEGIKMVSSEKLVVPTELFEPEELDGFRNLVAEVIDIEDYPDFIELEY